MVNVEHLFPEAALGFPCQSSWRSWNLVWSCLGASTLLKPVEGGGGRQVLALCPVASPSIDLGNVALTNKPHFQQCVYVHYH